MAAARKVSPAGDHDLLAVLAIDCASLAMLVVLPVPLTPTTRMTTGLPRRRRSSSPQSRPLIAPGLEDGHQLLLEAVAHRLAVLDALFLDALLDVAEDLLRRRDAGVGAEQHLLELVPQLVIDLAAVEEAGDAAEPALAGALERSLGLLVGFLGALEDAEQRGLLAGVRGSGGIVSTGCGAPEAAACR